MNPSRLWFFALIGLLAAVLFCSAAAWGGITSVTNGSSLTTVLYNQYGGGAGAITGTINTSFSYTNGVTLTRVQDFSGATNLAAGTAVLPAPIAGALDVSVPYAGGQDDQTWAGGVDVSLRARYRSAAHDQFFGYSPGATGYPTGTGFTQIISVGSGTNNPTAPFTGTLPATLRWARFDNQGSSLVPAGASWEHTSLNADNVDGRDHLLTFYISDPNSLVLPTGVTGGWLLAFEDLNAGESPDYDFNDAVVEVTAIPPRVPEPATMSLLAAGALALLGRRRRNR